MQVFFVNTFHLIDDLCAINDNGLLEKQFKEIYPDQLELKNENVSSTKTSFPDINLEINKNKIPIKPFNKRDSL